MRCHIIQKLRLFFHTGVQNSNLKNRTKNIASVQPALVEMSYQELVLDSSTASHPDTVQRICAAFRSAEGLVADLRHCNPGRPGNK